MAAVKHLTIKELAERLGLPVTSVYHLNSRGDGPKYLKIGQLVRYRLTDVEAWEEAREATGGRVGGGAAA